jgi:hypothetical protein
VCIEELRAVGGQGGQERKVRRRNEGREEKRREKIGGKKGKWSNRRLSDLVFGKNGRGM